MLLRIISAEGELYSGNVHKVVLPTDSWYLGILPWHMNLVTPLVIWVISYLPDDKPLSLLDSFADHTDTYDVVWGLAMIEEDIVTVVLD